MPGRNATSTIELMQHELARINCPVQTTVLRVLVGSHRGETLPAERLGPILGYERRGYIKHRRAPRLALALMPDAKPSQPQRLGDGDWRLGRRLVTPDALAGHAAALGARLCERAQEAPWAFQEIFPHVKSAAEIALERVLGSSMSPRSLQQEFLQAQPHSADALSPEQAEAERSLLAQEIGGAVQFFGSDEVGIRERSDRVRVLVGDSQPMFLEALARVIRRWPEFELVGAVGGDEFLPALLDLQPDVSIVDPDSLSTETKDEIFVCAGNGMRVLFIFGEAGPEIYEALNRGAIGCLTKEASPRELCDAIAAAARGNGYMARDTIAAIAAGIRLRSEVVRPYLSKRQLQVLALIADGLTAKQVGERLVIAETTVKTHLRAIYKTLEVNRGAAAVVEAMRHGLIE